MDAGLGNRLPPRPTLVRARSCAAYCDAAYSRPLVCQQSSERVRVSMSLMPDDDTELKPGTDKPRRGQYAIGVLVIAVLAAIAYWRLGH
jgi:hypothetical protein